MRSAVWLVPTLFVAGAILAAVGLIALDRVTDPGQTIFLFPGPPSGARAFLSAIVQAMISFTGVVFSVTIVVLQLSSGQFSPRVLRRFLQDRTIQLTLGIFVATFVYAMVVLRGVKGGSAVPQTPFVPKLAVTGALVLVLFSVGFFIKYIGHVLNLIRVATVIQTIGDETRSLLLKEEARYGGGPAAGDHGATAEDQSGEIGAGHLPGRPDLTLHAPHPGVMVSVNHRQLLELADRTGSLIALAARMGDFVPGGGAVMHLYFDGADPGGPEPGDPEPVTGKLKDEFLATVAFDSERTMEQDVAFGLRQLVDIAERALSPSVNDPTTASQSIDQIHDILRRLVGRPAPRGSHFDEDGRVRLVTPQYRFADYLDFAVGEIWCYGSEGAQIKARLTAMLEDLECQAAAENRPCIRAWQSTIGGTAGSAGGEVGTARAG